MAPRGNLAQSRARVRLDASVCRVEQRAHCGQQRERGLCGDFVSDRLHLDADTFADMVEAWKNDARVDRESLADSIVGSIVGVIEHRRIEQGAYGRMEMTEDQRDEISRAIAQHLLMDFKIERNP